MPCEASALSTPTPRPSKTRSSPAATSSTAATSCRFATKWYGVCHHGRPIAETATRFGVSRPTYYKLSAEFEREGICGLLPKKRSPKGGTNYVQVVEALRAARTQDPAVDAASLVELVKRRFGVEINARTIERALKKNARERARSRCWPRAFSDRALRGTAKRSVRGDGCLQRPWAGLADALWCGGLDASMGRIVLPTSNST